jgi:hypothetical protein
MAKPLKYLMNAELKLGEPSKSLFVAKLANPIFS